MAGSRASIAGARPELTAESTTSHARSSGSSRARTDAAGHAGCGPLTAAKIVGETADVRRFKSKDAFARHNGTAPLPVWSGNRERSPTLTHREPPAQRRDPPHRGHPDADVTDDARITSNAGEARQHQHRKPCAPSSDDSPMSSTGPSSPTPSPPPASDSHPRLDIGAGITRHPIDDDHSGSALA